MIEIESFSNPKFKFLKRLSKSRNRKKEGVFLMEGRPELDLAIKSGLIPQTIVFTDAYISLEEINGLYKNAGNVAIKLNKALFEDLAYQHVSGNFMAVFESFDVAAEDLDWTQTVVVLENVEKPGNLGAILRTCDAFGIRNVVLTASSIDIFNPNTLRNSRGAFFGIKCAQSNNEGLLQIIRNHGLSVYAAALVENAIHYNAWKPESPCVLVFGAESTGLSDFWLRNADQCVVIPMSGITDSLNLSVTVGILLSTMQLRKLFN